MIDLFQNPFALLDVTVQDTAAALREAAEQAVAEGRLGEAEADAAAQMLLDPEARLEAEISWLIGRSAPRIRTILETLRTKPDTPGRLALLDTIDGVARSNLAAHLCSVERAGVPVVRAMVEAQNEITPEAVFWLVNGNRELSGFPPVPEAALWAALEALQAQHCAAVCEAISARDEHRKFMVRLFADGWTPLGPAYAFLERVVGAYDAWYDAHLAAIEARLSRHISTLMANSSDDKATRGIKKCLALWDEYSTPLQHPTVDNQMVAERATSMHSRVSAMCRFLAQERWRFRAALQISESLGYAFPGFPPVQLGLPEHLDALAPLLAQGPAQGAPQELARVMAELLRDSPSLARSLAADGFRRGERNPAGTLYSAFTTAMAEVHGTPSGEGIWIMLRCLALDLHTRHGHTAGAVGLLEGLLGQADDHLMPSEVRRMLENDAARLRHAGHRRELETAVSRRKFRAAERLVETLLLNPPGGAEHDELLRIRSEIQEALAGKSLRWWLWPLVAAGLLISVMVLVVAVYG